MFVVVGEFAVMLGRVEVGVVLGWLSALVERGSRQARAVVQPDGAGRARTLLSILLNWSAHGHLDCPADPGRFGYAASGA